ncbi:hypothetical protein OAJ60_04240 [Planctomycetaceae bacterium]|nr:hypothetical protein [Planctomycetaceae bacterium]
MRVLLAVLLVGMIGCDGDVPESGSPETPPIKSTGLQATRSNVDCEVMVLRDVEKYFELLDKKAYAFRFSGAPLQLSLEVYHQKITPVPGSPLSLNDRIDRSQPTNEDRIVSWTNVKDESVSSFETGKWTKEAAKTRELVPHGRILLFIDEEQSVGKLVISETKNGKDNPSGLSVEFPLPDTSGQDSLPGDPESGAKSPLRTSGRELRRATGRTTIKPGDTESLLRGSWYVRLGSVADRFDIRLRVRCLREPASYADPPGYERDSGVPEEFQRAPKRPPINIRPGGR